MPFMALMAAPLSAMLSVTGGDGSLDYPSHTRARTADNLFWRHHVSPTGDESLGRRSVEAGAQCAAPPAPGATRLGQRARGVVSLYLRTLAREGRMTVTIGRRELLAALGGAVAGWPLACAVDLGRSLVCCRRCRESRDIGAQPARLPGTIRKN